MTRSVESRPILLCAGGTGGHLFPAEALATELNRRGITVELAIDKRVAQFQFPARAVHLIASATVRGRNPFSLARTVAMLGFGTGEALALIGRSRPAAVVGFGGYPTVPPLLAAWLRRVPTVLHEQNGVMGRANRLLAARVSAIATGFRSVNNLAPALQSKATFTGNPVRRPVLDAASTPYEAPKPNGLFHLLVFGGSQGARVTSEIVPAAVAMLEPALRARMRIVQQARAEDVNAVTREYERIGVAHECAAFFSDLPARIAAAHLVVSRSGASTVAELSAIGRPAILVPLPHALDQDQLANASVLERAGGALTIVQREFAPERLASELARLAADPAKLAAMAAAAKSCGSVDAAERLADVVMRVAGI